MVQNQQEITGSRKQYPRYRWVMVGLILITQQIGVLVIGGIGILLPAIRGDLGFGMTESGVLASIGRLPMVILAIPASLILVRFSPKRVYLVSISFAAITGFIIGQAPTYVLLAIAYSLMGTAMVVREVPDTLLKLQWIPKKEFATIMGISMGMIALGQSMSIMIIPFLLIVLGGWRNVFFVYSLAVLLMSVVWMVFAKNHITPEYREDMSSQAGRAPLRGVLKRKEFSMIGIAIFGNALTYMTTLLFLPTYLLEERGMALTTIGLIVGLMPIGGVCANLTMGFISDKIGLRKPTIWPAGFIQPFLYFGLISPIPIWALPVLTFLVGFVAWSPFPAIRTIPFELSGVKPSEVAVGQSLIQTITTLGIILGAPIAGYLAEAFGSLKTALLIICIFPLTMAIVGFLLPETGTKARPRVKENGKRYAG
ncbi:MFS transporter [Chloroflexota bacterium]